VTHDDTSRVIHVTSQSTRQKPRGLNKKLITVALLNIVPLETIIFGENTQDRSVISRYFSHHILTQVVQYLARLRYQAKTDNRAARPHTQCRVSKRQTAQATLLTLTSQIADLPDSALVLTHRVCHNREREAKGWRTNQKRINQQSLTRRLCNSDMHAPLQSPGCAHYLLPSLVLKRRSM
jgi:hypothetical protein